MISDPKIDLNVCLFSSSVLYLYKVSGNSVCLLYVFEGQNKFSYFIRLVNSCEQGRYLIRALMY